MSSMDMAAVEAKLVAIMAQLEARDKEKKELEAELRTYCEARDNRESKLEDRLRAQEEEITRAYAELKKHDMSPTNNTDPSGETVPKTLQSPKKPEGIPPLETVKERGMPNYFLYQKSDEHEKSSRYKDPNEEKFERLDRKFKMLEEHSRIKESVLFDPWSVVDQEGAVLPPKFKMPEIERFDGTGCPTAHVESYTWAMQAKGVSFQVMASCFHLTLSGAAKEWYMSLSVETKKDWARAAQLFQKRYQDNTYYRPTKRELERTVQASGESFAAFATRWREKMNKLVDRPDASEQIYMFTKCLNDEYQDKLSNSYWPDFAAIYEAGMRIEEFARLKKGKTPAPAHSSSYRYNKTASSESRDNAVNAVSATSVRNNASAKAAPVKRRQYSNLGGRTIEAIFHTLVEKGKMKPVEGYCPRVMPENWAHDKWCAYHQYSGHNTNECYTLKDRIQDLIDKGEIEAPANTVHNPLPNDVHAIEFEGDGFDSTMLVTPAIVGIPMFPSDAMNEDALG